VVAGGLTLGLTAAHLASRSRGGLVALLAGFALLTLLAATRGRGARRKAIAFATLGGVAVGFGALAIPAGARLHLASVLAGPSGSSGSYRLGTAAATLRAWGAAPLLGWGLGAYADAIPPFKRAHGNVRTTHAESDALELTAEGGLLGLALAGALALAVGRRFGQRLERGRDPVRDGVTLGAGAGAGAMLVHSLFDFNLRLPANALVLAVVVALAAAPHGGGAALGRRRSALGAAAFLALAAGASAWRAQGARSLRLAQQAPDWRRITAFDSAIDRHPYLAEAFLGRALAWRRLAAGQPGARLQRASRDLERALRRRPFWGEACAELAWTRYVSGDVEGAASDFARAAAVDPTHRGIALARAAFLGQTLGRGAALAEIRRLQAADTSWSEREANRELARWQEGPL
jgi:tetratricopeptide (TPR) repeat protein